jgi:hypothetical protein
MDLSPSISRISNRTPILLSKVKYLKYIQFLKDEGSILYQSYKADPTVFSLKKLDEDGGDGDFNEFLSMILFLK